MRAIDSESRPSEDAPDSRVALARWYHRQRLRWQTWWHCGRHYAGSIDPADAIELAPGAIKHALPESRRKALERTTPPHVQAVVDGCWDLETDRFLETDRYRRVASLVRDARAVREGAPREMVTTDGGQTEDTAHREALEWYLADLVTRGAVSIADRRTGRTATESTVADPYPQLPAVKGEIRVNIGRDGRCILHSGHERLALAQMAGLESVPVHVYVRHERWQRRRDRIALTGADTGSHPDLTGLLPGYSDN